MKVSFSAAAQVAVALAVALFITAAGVASARAEEEAPPQISVLTGTGGGAGALSITSDSIACTQGAVVLDGTGKLGYVVPVVGATVLRGSRDLGQTTYFRVLPIESIRADQAVRMSLCKKSQ